MLLSLAGRRRPGYLLTSELHVYPVYFLCTREDVDLDHVVALVMLLLLAEDMYIGSGLACQPSASDDCMLPCCRRFQHYWLQLGNFAGLHRARNGVMPLGIEICVVTQTLCLTL